MTESKSKPTEDLELETLASRPIFIHTPAPSAVFFISLLVANDLSVGDFFNNLFTRAKKSYEDEQLVRAAFRDLLVTVNPRRFGVKQPNTQQTRRQKEMETMFKEIEEKERGWSKEDVQKLYELFEEVQAELAEDSN